MPEITISTLPDCNAESRSANGIVFNFSSTSMAPAIICAISGSSPMTVPSFAVMLSGGMLPAVPTTNSFFFRMRSITGDDEASAALGTT